MNEFETTLHIMMMNHISYDDLANRMGQPNGGNLYNALNKNKNIHVKSLLKIMNAMGYEIVVRPKNGKGSEYIIDNDNTPSPLRFHGMNLNLDSMLSGKPVSPKMKPSLTIGERNLRSEELKKKIGQISFTECDNELREIWSMKDPLPDGKLPYNKYECEYERYKEEFSRLYTEKINPALKKQAIECKIGDIPPVISSAEAQGEDMLEVSFNEKDMSLSSVINRAKAEQKSKGDILSALVPDLQMDD